MNQTVFNDLRGKFEVELRDGGLILLTFTPSYPHAVNFAMDAEDARLFATALLEYADTQDAEKQP